MAGIEFKALAQLLSCREFAQAEGLRMQGGRMQCPFHGGRNFNLTFYGAGDHAVHCYKCGRTADVIGFASAVWHVSQKDAAQELNARFRLGLEAETLTAEDLARREADRQRERELREAERRAEAQEWSEACEAERAAQRAVERFTAAEADTPAFNQALQRLAIAHQRCDLLQAARTGRC